MPVFQQQNGVWRIAPPSRQRRPARVRWLHSSTRLTGWGWLTLPRWRGAGGWRLFTFAMWRPSPQRGPSVLLAWPRHPVVLPRISQRGERWGFAPLRLSVVVLK